MPEAIDLKLFPLEKDKKNFDEDISSINIEFTIIDTCDLINDLDEKIKQFRIKNKLAIEKEKKMEIKNEEQNEGESERFRRKWNKWDWLKKLNIINLI